MTDDRNPGSLCDDYFSLDIIADQIGDWGRARNLIEGATMKDQLTKLMEETGELAGGIARQKQHVIEDSIGDCFVVLTLLALQAGKDVHTCARNAYNTIKDRKGKMVDGVFVRDCEPVEGNHTKQTL